MPTTCSKRPISQGTFIDNSKEHMFVQETENEGTDRENACFGAERERVCEGVKGLRFRV
jgi:hypothetical protein